MRPLYDVSKASRDSQVHFESRGAECRAGVTQAPYGGQGSRDSQLVPSNMCGMQATMDDTAHKEPAAIVLNHAGMVVVCCRSL